MLLGNFTRNSNVRFLLPVARDLMKACCPRYLRSALEEEAFNPVLDESSDDEAIENPGKTSKCCCALLPVMLGYRVQTDMHLCGSGDSLDLRDWV